MALIHSKQLNPRLTGSFSLSGSIIGDSKSTASFGSLQVANLDFDTAVSQSAASTGFAASAGVASRVNFDGNRRVLNKKFPELISSSFNAGTTGSITDFLNAVFFPNTAPTMSNAEFDIHEFVTASHTVGTVTANDAEHFSYELTFSTQSSYTDDFFSIHSGSGVIKTKVKTSSTMNTSNRETDGAASHLFPIEVTDGIAVTQANVFIRVTPNLPPKFRTTSVSGNVITANTGNVNENTTNGTTVLTMFVTDTEDDAITVSPLSQSSENRFSASVSDVVGGKRIVLTTATASFDFETITTHSLFISASDEHHLEDTASLFLTNLPIEVRVTDNLAPTMANQSFTVSESSGSHGDNGLGASSNGIVSVGNIVTNDPEDDTVTYVALNLISGSGGGNTSQQDPSNNPFSVTSTGNLRLSAGQFLNSDIENSYIYSLTYRDNFNGDVTSGDITVNISPDPTPSLQPNSANFYLIESAVSGAFIKINDNGRTGTNAKFTSGETVSFQVNPSDKFSINSDGEISVNFNVSGSEFSHFKFQTVNPPIGTSIALSGSVTASNAFGTKNTATFDVITTQNTAPTLSFSNNSDNLNSNEARPTETGGGLLSTITITDAESDSLNHSSFTLTDPSGQLSASRDGDTFKIFPRNNLSGSKTYQMTASIKDIHGFNTGTKTNSFTIAGAHFGTLGGDITSSIIESQNNGAALKDSGDGRTGNNSQLTVAYSNPEFGSPAVVAFTSSNSSIAVDNSGNLTLGFQLSGSTTQSGDVINSDITYQDQYGNVGSGSIRVDVTTNNAPVPSFTDNSDNLNSNEARPTETGGGLLSTITITDAESDSLNHSSFTLTDPSGQLSASRDGDTFKIFPRNNLSGSKTYQMTASIKDIHGFNTGTKTNSFTIAGAHFGTLGGDITSSIIESQNNGAALKDSGDGRTGNNSQLTVAYSNPEFGSPAVVAFTSSNSSIAVDNSGNLTLGFQLSGSTTQSGDVINSDITYQDQYGNVGSGSIRVDVTTNNAPVPSFTDNSDNLNSNEARPTETGGGLLSTITFTDAEGDNLNHSSFVFTDPSGQLSASRDGNTFEVFPRNNLSGSTTYQMTASIKDIHGFRTGTQTNTFNIVQAPLGTMSTNGIFYIIESARTGDLIRLNSNGLTGTQGDLNVTYSSSFGSATVQNFTSSNAMLSISDSGNISLAQNVSGSAFTFNAGNTIDSNITYQDQYGNIGSGSISINVAKNNPPVITLSNQTLTDFPAEKSVSGSFITSASFSDAESNNINFDSFTIGGTHGNLFTSKRSGNSMIITTNTDLSASLSSYQYNVTVKDEHGFHTSDSVAGSVAVTPVFYFYKLRATNLGASYAGNPIGFLGDVGGDDVGIASASVLAHFKSGSIGESAIGTVSGPNTGSLTLVSSQSLYHLSTTGSNVNQHSTWRGFGLVSFGEVVGTWICVFPSSSATLQLPSVMEDAKIGNFNDNTTAQREYAVYDDNDGFADGILQTNVHYFSTANGVDIRGNTRFGMIFPEGTSTGNHFYHYVISSGSTSPNELD